MVEGMEIYPRNEGIALNFPFVIVNIAYPIIVRPNGKVTLVRDAQASNAKFPNNNKISTKKLKIPMEVMVEGMETVARDDVMAFPSPPTMKNIEDPITVNPIGNNTSLRDPQP